MAKDADYRTPGQYIAKLLEDRGWTQRVLAIVLGVDETGLNKLVAGKRPVDAEFALALSDVFGVAPERFLEIQKAYELAQARIVARPDPRRATRALLFGDLPIGAMIKRGWIQASDVRDVKNVEAELVRFFGAASPEEIEILPHAAKKTDVAGDTTPAQLAWLYRVKQLASEMLVPPFSEAALRQAIERLSPLRISAENARLVPRILEESGIRFVVVEPLPRAKIDGVCFWLGDSPVIGMALRHDRVDNFWFVLRHELEHALLGHGRNTITLDTELEGERAGTGDSIAEEERLANAAASEFCVPQKAMDSFVARKAPFFAERDIVGFSRVNHIHPGLVAGQLQRRTGRYDRFRTHQVPVRKHVLPCAMSDGWGDVAPVGEHE